MWWVCVIWEQFNQTKVLLFQNYNKIWQNYFKNSELQWIHDQIKVNPVKDQNSGVIDAITPSKTIKNYKY